MSTFTLDASDNAFAVFLKYYFEYFTGNGVFLYREGEEPLPPVYSLG